MREERTEVLIVGAGPVGLLSAILLAEAGIDVRIIDRETTTTVRSYACALHPATLQLLDRAGLAAHILDRGRRIETMAFYEGATRHAEVKLSGLGGAFPFMVILPQNALEATLEQRLRELNVRVQWNHRFSEVQSDVEAAVATVEELGPTATGYIVPHWETIVKRSFPLRAQFVIGADGCNSLVRQRLGIEQNTVSGPEFFAAYEFEPGEPVVNEVRVAMDAKSTNVLWPLLGNRYRWTFQVQKTGEAGDFPEKERQGARVAQPGTDERIRAHVEQLAKERAPWFASGVKEVGWCTEVVFEHRVTRQFGRDRCWLAGDAAHQTGPVGAQSMNVGMAEAVALCGTLRRILREKAGLDLLQGFDRERQAEWRRLLGLAGGLKPRKDTAPWLRERSARLLSCLPASHEDLGALAGQLGFDY